MELSNLAQIEKAARRGRNDSLRLGVGLMFVVGIMLYTGLTQSLTGPNGVMLVAAAMIGGYMAMNIGANDVANNVGPAVGSRAISMAGAVAMAAVFEAAGALIAGGDVVSTIQKGIIRADLVADPQRFIWLMTAALLAAALWLNLATALGAPVSTTHSIVGAVLGAGLAAGGAEVANWSQLGEIAASWVVSPVLGGLVAAGFLYWIKRSITWQADMADAARRQVPRMIGLMVFAFSTYLVLKGLNRIWKVGFAPAVGLGLACGLLGWWLAVAWVKRRGAFLTHHKSSVNELFTLPLIFSAALLSFAHGANDVANAVGPLAAVAEAVRSGGVGDKAAIPGWVMVVGAVGISLGLLLYGPKLIRKVGSEITELDQMRAFCIAMSAAVTVIVASQLGLPVSSTHIAVGGVFGVGFLREYLKRRQAGVLEIIRLHHMGEDKAVVEAFLTRFQQAGLPEKRAMLEELRAQTSAAPLDRQERKQLKKVYRQELVKRSEVTKIVAAWIVTVPATMLLAALLYYMIFGMVHA
ncbi:MAG: inorganic phosphate transporter [Burkholderiaceae bacterium]|nr:inorganic phosphate transporter [Burkholderiaceae bacterium]